MGDVFMGYPVVGNIDGDDVVLRDGKKCRVMWKDQFPPEPVFVEVT
jgi:hypothetical protein